MVQKSIQTRFSEGGNPADRSDGIGASPAVFLPFLFFSTTVIAATALFLIPSRPLLAEKEAVPRGVGIEQKLNAKLPLEMDFLDENGKQIKLKDLLPNRKSPLIIVPGYYKCTRLCAPIFKELSRAVKSNLKNGLIPGRDYRIASISINPEDTPTLAKHTGDNFRSSIQDERITPNSWRFLSGRPENVKRLMSILGYKYRKDGPDFTHPAAIIIITPGGRISRYLGGLNLKQHDYRFGLIEAAGGKIGNIFDRAFQLCFRWDNAQGKYIPIAWRFMQIGGLLTLSVLVGLVLFLRRKERNT